MEGRDDDRALTTAELAGREAHDGDRYAVEARGDERTPDEAPLGDAGDADGEPDRPLLPDEARNGLTSRWESIQTGFVDEPRKAVREADALVAEAMQQLAESFARERETLERQWDRGEEISTEDLRLALRRYRSFFRRLLSA